MSDHDRTTRGGRRASPRPVERGRRARHRALPDHRVPAGVRARGRSASRALTDVYNIANSTPNIVYELLLGGILTATLVPLYVEHYERDGRARRPTRSTPSRSRALAAISFIGFLAAPWIIDLYTLRLHGAGKAAQQALATDLLRWFMPQIFFYGLTALATAMLNARRRFAAAAFAPVLNNVVVIAALLALPRIASEPPTVTERPRRTPRSCCSLGLGTTAGIVAMALVLWPAVRHAGDPAPLGLGVAPPAPSASSPASPAGPSATSRRTRSRSGSRSFLAYGHSGDASIYLAAFTFFQLPHGLFAVSIMTALAPELASRASRGDFDGLRAPVRDGVPAHGARRDPRAPRSSSCSRARSSTRCSTTASFQLAERHRDRGRRWPWFAVGPLLLLGVPLHAARLLLDAGHPYAASC